MSTQEQKTGASLDELFKKLQDLDLAFQSFSTDLKGSQRFIAALMGLRPHARALAEKSGPVLVTPDQEKCLQIIEKYFGIYRRYLASPLCEELAGSTAEKRPVQNHKSARSWWPGFNRKK